MIEKLEGGRLLFLSEEGDTLVEFPLRSDDFTAIDDSTCRAKNVLTARISRGGVASRYVAEYADGEVLTWGAVTVGKIRSDTDILLSSTKFSGDGDKLSLTSLLLAQRLPA